MIPALMMAGFAAQALGTGINAYRSNKFMNEAQRQLRDLENNPIEPYKASTQLRTAYAGARAGAAAPRGMSMEEVNRFMINQARNENTALANAGKMGYGGRGNLAVLNAGLSGMSADLASKSAMMAERNRQADLGRLQGLSSTYQTLANMNANANMQAQAAYGRAIQQQRQNISGAWKSLADAGGMAAGYGMMATGAPKVPAATPAATEAAAKTTGFRAYENPIGPQNPNDWYYKNVYQNNTASPPSNDGLWVDPSSLLINKPFSPPQNAYNGMMAAQPTAGYQAPMNPVFMNYMNSQLTPTPGLRMSNTGTYSPVYGPMNIPYTTDPSF